VVESSGGGLLPSKNCWNRMSSVGHWMPLALMWALQAWQYQYVYGTVFR
jgi:hypothetical protein